MDVLYRLLGDLHSARDICENYRVHTARYADAVDYQARISGEIPRLMQALSREEFACSNLSRLVVEETIGSILAARQPPSRPEDEPVHLQEEMFKRMMQGVLDKCEPEVQKASALATTRPPFGNTCSAVWCSPEFALPIFIGLAADAAQQLGANGPSKTLFRFEIGLQRGALFGVVFRKASFFAASRERDAVALAFAQILAERCPDVKVFEAARGLRYALSLAGRLP